LVTLSIRKVKTKSASTAIQLVVYRGHRAKVIKHIGSSKIGAELSTLHQKAQEFIEEYTAQGSLFPEEQQKILFIERGECIAVTHQFARRFLLSFADQCGLSDIDQLLLDFSIMRLLEPASKLRTIGLLSHYFGNRYSQRIYRKIPKLIELKKTLSREHIDLL